MLKWFETTKKIKEEENKEIIKESNKQNKTVINKSNSVYLELNIEQSMNNNDLNNNEAEAYIDNIPSIEKISPVDTNDSNTIDYYSSRLNK